MRYKRSVETDHGQTRTWQWWRRLVLILGAVALAVFIFTSLGVLWHALLTLFGGVVLGVLFDGVARWISRWTKMPRWAALLVLAVLSLGACVGIGLWMGPAIADNLEGLREEVTSSWSTIRGWLDARSWGQRLLSEVESFDVPSSMASQVGGWVTTSVGSIGTAVLVLAFGIYLAIDPTAYRRGAVLLLPRDKRERAETLMTEIASALRSWMFGTFVSMVLVGVGTSIGLWIVGVPLALGLGLIAGLFAIVPNLGPAAAAIPGVLVALSVGPQTVLWALLVYGCVQAIESYALTPVIQQWVVSVPPALLLVFQLVMGLSGGVVGLVVAMPLLVAIIVIVQSLYVRDILREDIEVIGESDRHEDDEASTSGATAPARPVAPG